MANTPNLLQILEEYKSQTQSSQTPEQLRQTAIKLLPLYTGYKINGFSLAALSAPHREFIDTLTELSQSTSEEQTRKAYQKSVKLLPKIINLIKPKQGTASRGWC